MKKLLITLTTLTAVGVAAKVVNKKKSLKRICKGTLSGSQINISSKNIPTGKLITV